MTPADLHAIGTALYGVPHWQAQMARDLGLSLTHLNRLMRGTRPITDAVRHRLDDVCARREREVRQALRLMPRARRATSG